MDTSLFLRGSLLNKVMPYKSAILQQRDGQPLKMKKDFSRTQKKYYGRKNFDACNW